MIFLPRFKQDTLRQSQGLSTYSQMREALRNPANVPQWANLNVDALKDQDLQSTWDSFQGYRTGQANALRRQQLGNQPTAYGNPQMPSAAPQTSQSAQRPLALPRFSRGTGRRPQSSFGSFSRANARGASQMGSGFRVRSTF